ncbi:MAG: VTT domain-containing protein [Pseudomonadota bacterium]
MEETTLFATIMAWVEQYAAWAGPLVFLVSFAESVAVVGLVVPGAVFLFAVGALIGLGVLEVWPMLLWAFAGAVAGDALSYWLGRHYHDRLRQLWPLSRYPDLIRRGEAFFHRHGGKSVVLARFIGPLRPIVPAVAGMLDMPAPRFFVVNVLSAAGWSPAYLLPGAVFGASLGLAAAVAGRLAALVVTLVVVLWLGVAVVRRLFRALHPRSSAMVAGLLRWSARHPATGGLARALLDPDHPEARSLGTLALLALAAAAAFLVIQVAALASAPLQELDELVFHALQGLRTPAADIAMAGVTRLGSLATLGPVVALTGLWLLLRGHGRAAGYLIAGAVVVPLLAFALKAATDIARPIPGELALASAAFPSGHTAGAAVVYGFLAVLAAARLGPVGRRTLYATVAVPILLVALSRLYLGLHWLSDILGGLALALAWITAAGLIYRRHHAAGPPATLIGVSVAALLVTGLGQAIVAPPEPVPAAEPPARTMPTAVWHDGGWRALPAHRQDLAARRDDPLNLQFAGDPEALMAALEAAGWQRPVAPRGADLLRLLAPATEPARLPLLPRVHDGRYEAARRIRTTEAGELQVVRLWPTAWRLADGRRLWVGQAGSLRAIRPAGLFTGLAGAGGHAEAAAAVARALTEGGWRVERDGTAAGMPVYRLASPP